jgi:hypothetical protein
MMMIAVVGILITLIAIIVAVLKVRRTAAAQQRQEKILLFSLYFWVVAFGELIVTSIVYAWLKH